MNQRDKDILESLRKFRVLNRDQIIGMHFTNTKEQISSCNKVLKRLHRDKLIDCDTTRRPYNYFSNPPMIRKDSMKLFHFQAIADFYLEAAKFGKITQFEVEYKTGEKGSIEPDIFMVWNQAPFFVEIQRSVYAKKVMNIKIDRYKTYYEEGSWKNHSNYFPYLLIITDHTYSFSEEPLKIFQAPSIKKFVEDLKREKMQQNSPPPPIQQQESKPIVLIFK
jgi:Replication-relaxation